MPTWNSALAMPLRAAFAMADPVEPPVIIWPFHYIACGAAPASLPPDLFDLSLKRVPLCSEPYKLLFRGG